MAYALFDYRGVHILRGAKIVRTKEKNHNPALAEAKALYWALVQLQIKGLLPVTVQIDNRIVFDKLNQNLSYPNEELDDIIWNCKHIIIKYNMQNQVEWGARQSNVLVDSLIERAKIEQTDIDETDLDPELCRRTWAEMFGHFRAYLSRTFHTSHKRQTYILWEQDGLAQKLLRLINMGIQFIYFFFR